MGGAYEAGTVVIAQRTVHARSQVLKKADHDYNRVLSLPIIKGEILTIKAPILEHGWLVVENSYQVEGLVEAKNVQASHSYSFEDFYISDMTAKMAETYLSSKEYGTFIVRPNSRNADKIVISVMFDCVCHYTFHRCKDGVEHNGNVYQSIPSFVNKCSVEQVLAGKLRTWVKQSDLQIPNFTEAFQTFQSLSMRIVAGSRTVAIEDYRQYHPLCLPLQKGQQYTVIRACRDPQMFIARDEEENEGYVPACLLECYIPDWFHGRLDRNVAEQILTKTCRDGTFIVRERPMMRGMFALSVWCPDSIVHVPLDYQNGYLVTGGSQDLPRFECLLDLVDHYRRETVFWTVSGECVRILFPLSRKETSLPAEIHKMDLKSIDLYFKALKEGREHVRDIRLMVIGHHGAGKTTLTERLMGKPFVQVGSTNGIEIHIRTCQFNVSSGIWNKTRPGSIFLDDEEAHALRLQRLMESPDEERTSFIEDLKRMANNGSKRSSMDHFPHLSSSDSLSNVDNLPLDQEMNGSSSRDSGACSPSTLASSALDNTYEIDTDNNEIPRYKFSMGTLKAISETFGKRARHDSKTEKVGFITMWDFAGQYIFYATHQVFLGARAVYLLVLDLSKDLDDFVEDEDFPLEGVDIQGRSVKDYGDFWLRSIHTFCGDIPGQPPVILVGTHKEQMRCEPHERDAMAEQYFEKFRKLMEGSPVSSHIQPEQFAIDNSLTNEDYERLKVAIVTVAKRQRYWNQEVPARWLPLERSLCKLRHSRMIVSLSEVLEADKSNEVSIGDLEEIVLFLRYQHAVGNVIYFDDERLGDSVVLNPQWIIDAFKSLITASRFCRLHSNLRPLWQSLQTKAILKDELIDEVWKQDADFIKHREKLLLYMERLDIIARPQIAQQDDNPVNVDFYFVPSLLRVKGTNHSQQSGHNPKYSTPCLCFVFNEGFTPPAIFQRMLGACLSTYSVVSQADVIQLFCDLGVFKLDAQHCFTLCMTAKVMKLQVVNMVEESVKPSLCDTLRRFMTYLLEEELGRYQQNVPFSICVECGRQDNCDATALLDCKELLKEGKLPCLAHPNTHIVHADVLLQSWFPDYVEISQTSQGQNDLTQSWISRLPEVVKNREVTERDLSKMSQCLGLNWEFVPLELGLSQSEIDQCKLDYKCQTAMQIYLCLLKWKLRHGSQATILSLVRGIDATMGVVVNWELVKNVVDCLYQDQ